jgi:hypothetical protein
MRCPPSGDSFDSLDIDDDALFGNIPNFHTSKQSAGDPEDVGKVEDQNVNSSAFRHTSTSIHVQSTFQSIAEPAARTSCFDNIDDEDSAFDDEDL